MNLERKKNWLIAKTSLVGTGMAAGALMTAGLLVLSEKFQDMTDDKVFKPMDRIEKLYGEIMALETAANCAILDDLRREFVRRYKELLRAKAHVGSFRTSHTSEDEGWVTYHVPRERIDAEEEAELGGAAMGT